ncbi:MAG TPA: class III extradiol ring-cleavage dioxygenase [Archangium sp.]
MRDDEKKQDGLTRRQVTAAGVVGLAGIAAAPAILSSSPKQTSGAAMNRMPVAFFPHGGGPWPFVDLGFPKRELEELETYLKGVPALTKQTPKAIVIVSAHWEERVPTVMTAPKPPMLYDYDGFPEESYRITWPAPGSPAVGKRVRELLGAAGIESAEDPSRGFDHGAFVPLKVMYPEAQIPTIQLSLEAGLDPEEHLRIGRALAPLRDEGVFLVGSGETFHNLRAFRDPRFGPLSNEFDQWLQAASTAAPASRDAQLGAWLKAPHARLVHPREEHLIPLMVIAGAAGEDKGTTSYVGSLMGMTHSGYHFG